MARSLACHALLSFGLCGGCTHLEVPPLVTNNDGGAITIADAAVHLPDAPFDASAIIDAAVVADANVSVDSQASDSASAVAGMPEHPAQFSIGMAHGACYGVCPVYRVSIDQDGAVDYYGGLDTMRPGAFKRTVPASDARAVYDALHATAYDGLKDLATLTQDGCLVLDVSETDWTLRADTYQKSVTRFEHAYSEDGCEGGGPAALQAVDAVTAVLLERAGVSGWTDVPSGSGGSAPAFTQGTYRVSAATGVVGLLDVRAGSTRFALRECSGTATAQGDLLSERTRWTFLADAHAPITLPGLGTVGSLLVALPASKTLPSAPIQVRALRTDDELALTLTRASGC